MYFGIGEVKKKRRFIRNFTNPADRFIGDELPRKLVCFTNWLIIALHVVREKPADSRLCLLILYPCSKPVLIVEAEIPGLWCTLNM